MLNFKAGIMPGDVNEYVFAGGTVRDALELAGLPKEGYEIMLNGAKASLDTPVTNNAYIILTKQIKGNSTGGEVMVTFKAGIMPGDVKEYIMASGTVRDALELAELPKEGYEIMLNGAKVTLDTPVPNNAYIILTKQIKGN